jgi:hypothetical protein
LQSITLHSIAVSRRHSLRTPLRALPCTTAQALMAVAVAKFRKKRELKELHAKILLVKDASTTSVAAANRWQLLKESVQPFVQAAKRRKGLSPSNSTTLKRTSSTTGAPHDRFR